MDNFKKRKFILEIDKNVISFKFLPSLEKKIKEREKELKKTKTISTIGKNINRNVSKTNKNNISIETKSQLKRNNTVNKTNNNGVKNSPGKVKKPKDKNEEQKTNIIIQNYKKEIDSLNDQIEKKQKTIKTLETQLKKNEEEINNLKKTNQLLSSENNKMNKFISSKYSLAISQAAENEKDIYESKSSNYEKQISDRNKTIEELKKKYQF